MADRSTNWERERNNDWDRERNNERSDWQQREEAWRRNREAEASGGRYREHTGASDRPEERRPYEEYRPYNEMGRRGGEFEYQRRRYVPRGDYGPSAFNPGAGRDMELFGTGSRGYGTTWGSSGTYTEGRDLYRGDQPYYGAEGRHAGKGPKGYRRADDRIREDVCECLTRHAHIDATEVEVRVKDGEVTLTGTVERREEKRLAEDAAERVPGVQDVHNQLRMQSPSNVQQQASGEQQHLETAGAGSRRR